MKTQVFSTALPPEGDVSLYILPRICLNPPFETNFPPFFLGDRVSFEFAEE